MEMFSNSQNYSSANFISAESIVVSSRIVHDKVSAIMFFFPW